MAQPGGAFEMPHGFGLRMPIAGATAPAAAPVAWKQWEVTMRAKGFHVSRETRDGSRTEFLLNEVRRVRIFRRLQSAMDACNDANRSAA
jgi:hypothetical protein